jgi:hypothetical protein
MRIASSGATKKESNTGAREGDFETSDGLFLWVSKTSLSIVLSMLPRISRSDYPLETKLAAIWGYGGEFLAELINT